MGNQPSKKFVAETSAPVSCAQCSRERGARVTSANASVPCLACGGRRKPTFRRAASTHFTKIRKAIAHNTSDQLSLRRKKSHAKEMNRVQQSHDDINIRACAAPLTATSSSGSSRSTLATRPSPAKRLARMASCPALTQSRIFRMKRRQRVETTNEEQATISERLTNIVPLQSPTPVVAIPIKRMEAEPDNKPLYIATSPINSCLSLTSSSPEPPMALPVSSPVTNAPASPRIASGTPSIRSASSRSSRRLSRLSIASSASNATAVAYAMQYEIYQQKAAAGSIPALVPLNSSSASVVSQPRSPRSSEYTLRAASVRSPRSSLSSASTCAARSSIASARSSSLSRMSRRSIHASQRKNTILAEQAKKPVASRYPTLMSLEDRASTAANQSEQDRLNAAHYFYQMELGANHFTKLDSANQSPMENVLDVGCGTGAWCLEMAAEHPQTNFVGVDLLPLYPADVHPDNCRFVQADALQGLPFADESFDFVHMRDLGIGVPSDVWAKLLSELLRVTKPGGRVEICDSDMVPRGVGQAGRLLAKWTHAALSTHGIDPTSVRGLPRLMQDVGFEEVRMHLRDFKDGIHAGEMGRASAAMQLGIYRALSPFVARTLCMDELVFERNLMAYERELESMPAHHHVFYMVARRPGWSA